MAFDIKHLLQYNKNMKAIDIQNKINVIGKKYNLKKVFLFGSFANNTANENSDIDLHIYLKKPIGLITHSNMLQDCKSLFNKNIDIIIDNGEEDSFINNIKQYEQLIYEG